MNSPPTISAFMRPRVDQVRLYLVDAHLSVDPSRTVRDVAVEVFRGDGAARSETYGMAWRVLNLLVQLGEVHRMEPAWKSADGKRDAVRYVATCEPSRVEVSAVADRLRVALGGARGRIPDAEGS